MSARTGGQNFEAFSNWCIKQNVEPPAKSSRHHVVSLSNDRRMIWERHHEFITLTWDCPLKNDSLRSLVKYACDNETEILASSAELVSLVQLKVLSISQNQKIDLDEFDPQTVCVSLINDGEALIASDFKVGEYDATRFVIFNKGIKPISMGAVVRQLLEVETYRMLALIGFVETQDIMPMIKEVEDRMIDLTGKIDDTGDVDTSRTLLKTLTKTASKLEAVSASSQFRISATSAYYQLVESRLKKLGGIAYGDYMSIEDFLARRLAPAMRTCISVEDRIAKASKKLSRATSLLRTKVDIQVEAQNNALLDSMDRRAKQQFHLQQTVEGLSIAAVSYYMVGLIGYLAKGSTDWTGISSSTITALSVPLVVATVWFLVRRIRKHYGE